MFSYDPALLDTIRPDPQTIDDVLGTMQAIENTCADADGLFNWSYMEVAKAVKARIVSGGFSDPG